MIVATCLGNELGNNLHLKYWYPELRHHLEQIETFNALNEEARNRLLDNPAGATAVDFVFRDAEGLEIDRAEGLLDLAKKIEEVGRRRCSRRRFSHRPPAGSL